MSEPYTPSVEEVRERFVDGFPIDTWLISREQCGTDFDRWLAAHDAQVRRDQAEADAQIVEAERLGREWAAAAIRASVEGNK